MDLTNLNKDRKVRRKSSIDLTTMVYGKLPPQAKELEEAVLGAIMLEKSAFDTVVEILKPECFYVEAHQQIYRAMQSLAQPTAEQRRDENQREFQRLNAWSQSLRLKKRDLLHSDVHGNVAYEAELGQYEAALATRKMATNSNVATSGSPPNAQAME